MITPSIPLNEKERLSSLESYAIMDSLPEEDFERISKIAAEILETPISCISLVDSSKQWFKSHYGTDVTQAPRDLSFCGHAILTPDEVFVIPDARIDPRFIGSPIVDGNPKIIFYAGAPLVNSKGLALGTLCAIDHTPHHPNKRQIEALKALSDQTVTLIELRSTLRELEEANQELEADNKRKDALLMDIHHRVNNHLQIINGMLQMHCDNEEEERIRSIFRDAQSKITSIALIHEKMYTTGELGIDSIEKHLVGLTEDMIALYSVENITTDVKIENLQLGLKTIVPLGLLINELLSNALKYAFKGLKSGKLVVHLSQVNESQCELIIGDNGIGMPDKPSGDKLDRLGSELIQIFSKQLEGTLVRLDQKGTMFRLLFNRID
jgi:two-component sensor histidine kinase